jgi:hypothetical protein
MKSSTVESPATNAGANAPARADLIRTTPNRNAPCPLLTRAFWLDAKIAQSNAELAPMRAEVAKLNIAIRENTRAYNSSTARELASKRDRLEGQISSTQRQVTYMGAEAVRHRQASGRASDPAEVERARQAAAQQIPQGQGAAPSL